ncbi:MAG TPA: CAP domain-containing protein [Pseudonocardiaceae bacterium]|nr:CAP domain-containing protein [Pseudonocardiaceae bacterium]
MNGSGLDAGESPPEGRKSRRRPSIQASLVAVLLGAAVAGSATVASRLSDDQPQVVDAAPDQPPALMVTADHLGPTPLGDTVSATATPSPTTTTTAPASTTTATQPITRSSASAGSGANSAVTPAQNGQAGQLIAYINAIRTQTGCQALREDGRLDSAAQQHSVAMSQHQSGGGDGASAQNTARGETSASQVIESWAQSRHDMQNIVNCGYATIGVGLVTNGWYWTADFSH